jgi:hypothetical protein
MQNLHLEGEKYRHPCEIHAREMRRKPAFEPSAVERDEAEFHSVSSNLRRVNFHL